MKKLMRDINYRYGVCPKCLKVHVSKAWRDLYGVARAEHLTGCDCSYTMLFKELDLRGSVLVWHEELA